MAELMGYKGIIHKILKSKRIKIGDLITIVSDKGLYKGNLMPRYESADEDHIIIKLENGYNIGVYLNNIKEIRRLTEGIQPSFIPPTLPHVDSTLPKVSIISTGGTIASRVDYRTGSVRPALTATELYSIIPELSYCAHLF